MCLAGIDSALPDLARARERRVGVDDLEVDLAADEAQRGVGQQRARQQARLAQDLEAVADAEHRAAVAGELDDRLHDRREARDRAGAQVVAVGEAAGDDDASTPCRSRSPCHSSDRLADLRARPAARRPRRRAGEADDAELHATVWIS